MNNNWMIAQVVTMNPCECNDNLNTGHFQNQSLLGKMSSSRHNVNSVIVCISSISLWVSRTSVHTLSVARVMEAMPCAAGSSHCEYYQVVWLAVSVCTLSWFPAPPPPPGQLTPFSRPLSPHPLFSTCTNWMLMLETLMIWFGMSTIC